MTNTDLAASAKHIRLLSALASILPWHMAWNALMRTFRDRQTWSLSVHYCLLGMCLCAYLCKHSKVWLYTVSSELLLMIQSRFPPWSRTKPHYGCSWDCPHCRTTTDRPKYEYHVCWDSCSRYVCTDINARGSRLHISPITHSDYSQWRFLIIVNNLENLNFYRTS
jgi:hypothetical protein